MSTGEFLGPPDKIQRGGGGGGEGSVRATNVIVHVEALFPVARATETGIEPESVELFFIMSQSHPLFSFSLVFLHQITSFLQKNSAIYFT